MSVHPRRLLRVAILAAVALAAIVPLAWMVSSSLKPEDEIYSIPPTWVPRHLTLQHYSDLFTRFSFARLTANSVLITVGVVAISIVLGAMAAYGFSRCPFRGSGSLLAALLMTRMITPSALLVPLYTLMTRLGQVNKLTGIIVGISILNLPFVVWIMKPFFDGLPKEIEEAAEMDGLSPVRAFWQIAMRLAAPALGTVLLFSFITGWVDLLFGMSFATTTQAMPLTAGLMQMQTGYKMYWGALMAGGTYLTLPTFLLSFGLQKYLLRGMRVGF